MSNKVNGLWAVNSSSVFMFFDSVNSPSVWRFEMKDGVESWRMIPGVKNAQAVRGVVAVTWRCAWCDCVALCRGCNTPMNASVSNDFHGVSISRFAQSIGCVYSESHQANDNERNRDGREATTTETTTARMVTRSPPNRRGMDD